MADQWGLLDPDEENELHKARLLNVEEKPLKRVTKRITTLNSLILQWSLVQAPTPPPESNGAPADQDASSPTGVSFVNSADLAQMREDITLDFAAFDSSIARIQFLLNANERERDRYAADRERIVNESQSVRESTSQLRDQLDQARATLEQRRKFDVLADKITSNPALKPRAEQQVNLKKLEEEIAELEAESKAYAVTWHERRDQFARIMDESMRLRRLIRDEKEEVERREGMDEGEGETEGHTPRPGLVSGNATPRPENGLLPKTGAESGEAVGTPRPLSTLGGRTPARDSPAPGQDSQSFLKPNHSHRGSFSQNGSRAPSRDVSPDRNEKTDQEEMATGGDVEMTQEKEEGETAVQEESEPDSPLSSLPPDEPPRILIGGQEDEMDTT